MLKPQAAVIHKIDRTAANNATIDGLTTTLNQSPPMPTPPTATGLIAILLAAVGPAACYGVALFDTANHANAATGAFTTFWHDSAGLGAAVHAPVVAASAKAVAAAVTPVAAAVNTTLAAAGNPVAEALTTPDARMVWVPVPLPVTTQLLVLLSDAQRLLVAAIRFVQQVLLAPVRRSQKP